MKSRKKFLSLLLLPVFVISVLLLKGCGNENTANDAGCPDGTVFASGSDVLTVQTADSAWTDFVYGLPGVYYQWHATGPVRFVVTDQFASEKNDICIMIYSDGVLWTDSSRTTMLTPVNGNKYPMKTDALGAVDIFFSAPVLVSNPSPSANVAGEDVAYQYEVIAVSGALQDMWKVDVTVSGCAADTFGTGTCP